MMNIFKDAVEHFRYDWINRRTLFFMEMWATLTAMLGSLWIALFNVSAPFTLVYCLFLSGSIVGIITGNLRKSGWLMTINIFFTIVNIVGVVRSL